ncbi:glucose-6-phosphate isomerase [Lichenifustis flavocetrariae]|uniref:Glucose-6-phosphate isomerase n=1 Tax=Lichenifustis flavocetrariae TaxID=2949735 RepID=A0AA41YUN0_9HYPH|nr:glucose-6-phosphate isomerase [Lichenifustis flavocetrariae]MCW6508886.1 glucose-6-phosphate isomerase [Lichenifustis flavocetrariae]
MEPLCLQVDVAKGTLAGGSGRYEKRLSDLGGIYADRQAFEAMLAEGDPVVYAVEDLKPNTHPGDMIFGVTRMRPGKIGAEFFVTRGHIHATGNRPEIYYGESGTGLMQLESPAGESRLIEIRPRSVCYVPPFWIHRSINIGHDDLVMTFAYPADSGQDYDIIARAGGMKQRVIDNGQGGWTAIDNPTYRPRTAAEIERVWSTAA